MAAGRETFRGANYSLYIYVLEAYLDDYKAAVWFDSFVRDTGKLDENNKAIKEDMFKKLHVHDLNEFGYCTDADCPDPDEMIEEWTFADDGSSSVSFAQGAPNACYKITAKTAMTLTIYQKLKVTSTIVMDTFSNDYIDLTKDLTGTDISLADGDSATVTLAAGETLYFTVIPGMSHDLIITKS